MSKKTVKIPKFRKVSRIAPWMEKNEYEGRMPTEVEDLFFTTKEDAAEVIVSLTEYQVQTEEPLSERLENLLYDKAKEVIPSAKENSSYNFLYDFLSRLRGRCIQRDEDDYLITNEELLKATQKYIELYKGKSDLLVQWAKWTKKRLPEHLEDSIDDPEELLDYAKEVVRGRVPSHLEDVFFKDVGMATQYAFDVIRGFAPVRLPEALHNSIVMKSYENTNDCRIKTYLDACDSDPNKTGNSGDSL